MDGPHLSQLLEKAATQHPHQVAVEDEHDRRLSYADLLRGADLLAARLARWGVDRGDRVGLWLNKSVEAVTSVHGILRTGASYVPVDPTGPALRAVNILAASGVKAVIVSAELVPSLSAVWPSAAAMPRLIAVAVGPDIQASPAAACDGGLVMGTYASPWADVLADDAPTPLTSQGTADDLAYILFTSGSTGRPKGVMLSHRNAFTFLDWCHKALGPWSPSDRFASHAPLHFDLSVFDLFAACRCAATLVLIGEKLGRDPVRLGEFLAKRHISVWYSAPSILALLARHGGLDRPAFPAPRKVLFAGEVFPIDALRALRSLWPRAAMWNLYGPTETNVCTAFPIPASIPANRTETYPIGRVCPPLSARVVNEAGRDLPAGTLGELVIAGPGVMRGYFGQPELTSAAFFSDALGTRWYRTGDLVADDGSGCFQFHGRRDRMVKKRGYRIELGEIESALHRYDGVEPGGRGRPGRRGRSLDRGVCCAQAEPEEIDHRAQAALYAVSATLHDSRHNHVSGPHAGHFH